jgi:hypothetical protein
MLSEREPQVASQQSGGSNLNAADRIKPDGNDKTPAAQATGDLH